MLHSHKPYRLLSDERLARLAAGRDDRAFSSLYQRHERALLAYCRSITRDGEDARDALQSAITAAYAAAPGRGHGSGPVRAWLFRIAHNESVNVLRRRRPDLPLVDTDLTPAPSAADQTTQRETAHEALAVVAQLPPRQRGALVLRELHGLDYGEIAAALSVTEVNARQLVFAARNGVAASR
ncbi:MAG TPA: sigma-70 family RNA polymerase sigma factor, partial [Thermoleophilaceae bacterium]